MISAPPSGGVLIQAGQGLALESG